MNVLKDIEVRLEYCHVAAGTKNETKCLAFSSDMLLFTLPLPKNPTTLSINKFLGKVFKGSKNYIVYKCLQIEDETRVKVTTSTVKKNNKQAFWIGLYRVPCYHTSHKAL